MISVEEKREKNRLKRQRLVAKWSPEKLADYKAKKNAARREKLRMDAAAEGRVVRKWRLTPEEREASKGVAQAKFRARNLEKVRKYDAEMKRKERSTPEGAQKHRDRQKEYADKNREKIKLKHKASAQANKEYHAKYKQEHYEANREKFIKLAKEYYQANKDKYVVYGRNYYARKKHNGGSHTAADIYELYYLQQSCCAWCGHMLTAGEKPHVDHWIPLSKGGSNDKSNLRLLHKKCNLQKSDKLPPDFKLTGTHN